MRSTEEQLREVMRRADIVKEKEALRRQVLSGSAVCLACLILLAAVSVRLPSLDAVSEGEVTQRYGSLLLTAPHLGYVIVGLLAFALGVCVTLTCVAWRKMKEKDQERK